MANKWVINMDETLAGHYVRNNPGHLVMEPQPTPGHSVDELVRIGLVGIYRETSNPSEQSISEDDAHILAHIKAYPEIARFIHSHEQLHKKI
jgi:hypothetical protein